jgi:phosphatidylglycerophosphatase C
MAELQVPRSIAIFDYDGTLVHRDSLLQFMVLACGWPKALWGLTLSLLKPHKGEMDYRTGVKTAWLRRCLKGQQEGDLRALAGQLKGLQHWKEPAYSALLKHKADGALIVVATGALDLYIRALLADLPVDLVLATELETTADGRLTGALKGGNCVRKEKARRVAALLAAEGPFAISYGYGNAPHDLPMLDLLDQRMVIR